MPKSCKNRKKNR